MNTQNFSSSSPDQLPRSADVVVVGAGIVGLAHAALAADQGHSVVVIDRDERAVGASVRNFGHCCITAQTGELYDLARAGRRHWLDFAARAGFWASESGAVVVARTPTELAVLQELSDHREQGQVRMLEAAEVAEVLGRVGADATTGILGGAWLRDDLRVDPRTTVGILASWLDSREGSSVHWGTIALGFDAGTTRRATVRTSRGAIEADHVFVCVGHDVDYLFPAVARNHRVQRCSLQMAAARAPAGLRLGPAILTGTSILRYAAFTAMPSATALRAELQASDPRMLDVDANIMFTQRPDGTLLLGDSHEYGKTADPFLSESTSTLLIHRVEEILGAGPLQLTQRWQGIYASSELGPLLVEDVADGVTAVSVTAGIGMTISFGLAERNVAARL